MRDWLYDRQDKVDLFTGIFSTVFTSSLAVLSAIWLLVSVIVGSGHMVIWIVDLFR